jgi:PilZ domain
MPEKTAAARTRQIESQASEQRARVRFPAQQASLCQRIEAETHDFWFMASIRDLSQQGVGLVVNCPFDPGLFLAVEPLGLKEEFSRGFQCRVVYAREEHPGRWFLGCEFVHPLSDQELQAFLEASD